MSVITGLEWGGVSWVQDTARPESFFLEFAT